MDDAEKRLLLDAVEAAEEVMRLQKLRELRGDFFCSKAKLDEAQERFDELARRAKEVAK